MARKKASLKKWIFLVAFLGIAGAVAYFGTRGGESGIEVTVRKADRGDLTSLVTATGKIQPEVEVSISSEAPGEIIELPVRDGDSVKRGDLLVRVNPDTLEAQVKQQEAGLASAKASSAQQRAQLLQAEMDLKRTEDLHSKGFATQDELEQARTRLKVNKAAYEASLHQIDRQEMQLREARDQLDKASTYSPIDGTVVRILKEAGDRVVGTGQFEGTEIMRVADLTRMEVLIEVSEAEIVDVAIGDRATIEVDAFPDQKFKGAVSEIANSADVTGARTQEELTTFEVKIQLDDPGVQLRPGMTATADIETETVTGVVRAPLGSVVVRPRRELAREKPEEKESTEEKPAPAEEREARPERGREGPRDDRVRVVFVVEDQTARLRQVETGIADRDYIEIQSGLEEGETIVTGSYRALTRELEDGSTITVSEKKREWSRD